MRRPSTEKERRAKARLSNKNGLRIRTRLDVVLWVGREIDDVCREPGYDEQHDRYQNRQHMKLSSLDMMPFGVSRYSTIDTARGRYRIYPTAPQRTTDFCLQQLDASPR